MKVYTSRGSLAGKPYTDAWVNVTDTGCGDARVCYQLDYWSERDALRGLRNLLRTALESVVSELDGLDE